MVGRGARGWSKMLAQRRFPRNRNKETDEEPETHQCIRGREKMGSANRKARNERSSKTEGRETRGKENVSRKSELLAARTAERLSQRNNEKWLARVQHLKIKYFSDFIFTEEVSLMIYFFTKQSGLCHSFYLLLP